MRTAPLLLVLLALANASASLAACRMLDSGPVLWGLALAQVQIIAACVVWLRRWLTACLAALAGCLIGWSIALAAAHDLHAAAANALALSGAALLTAACCGGVTFGGWRLTERDRREFGDSTGRQFSLATLLLIMTIVALYAGMLRAFEPARSEVVMLTVTSACAIAGFVVMSIAASIPGRLLAQLCFLCPVFAVVILSPAGKEWIAEWASTLIAVQLTAILSVMLVLRGAGLRLARPQLGEPRPSAASGAPHQFRVLSPPSDSAALASPRNLTSS